MDDSLPPEENTISAGPSSDDDSPAVAHASPPPIWKLPPEMFRNIFLCLVEDCIYRRDDLWQHPLHDFLYAQLVCRVWRAISLQSKILWSYIDLSWNNHLLDLCLDRTGPDHTLFFSAWDMDLDPDVAPSYFHILRSYHSRIRGIRIAGPHSEDDYGCRITANAMLVYFAGIRSFNFPLLESLEIDCPLSYEEAPMAKNDLPRFFRINNPCKLRCLRLGWYSTWDLNDFSDLAEFYWDVPYGLVYPNLSRFMTFLSNNSHSLERITLIKPHFHNDLKDKEKKPLTLPKLRSLVIDQADPLDLQDILDRISIPDHAELCLSRIPMLDKTMIETFVANQLPFLPSPASGYHQPESNSSNHSLYLGIGSNPSGSRERFWVRFYQPGFGARYYSNFIHQRSSYPLDFKKHLDEFVQLESGAEVFQNVTDLAFSFEGPLDGDRKEKCKDDFKLPLATETRNILSRFRRVRQLTYAGDGSIEVLRALLSDGPEPVCPALIKLRITTPEEEPATVEGLISLCEKRGCQVELMPHDEYLGIPTSRALPLHNETIRYPWSRPPGA